MTAARAMKSFENELEKQGGDINFTMRNIRDILLEDDMTLVNFEGTLTNSTYIPDNKKENSFLFSAPPGSTYPCSRTMASKLWRWKITTSWTMGKRCIWKPSSISPMPGSCGPTRRTFGVFTVKGVEIAMLSYQTFDRYDTLFTQVPLDVAEAKAKYPLVIVSFHWGAEKDYAPNSNQQKMGKMAIDAGADLVVGTSQPPDQSH